MASRAFDAGPVGQGVPSRYFPSITRSRILGATGAVLASLAVSTLATVNQLMAFATLAGLIICVTVWIEPLLGALAVGLGSIIANSYLAPLPDLGQAMKFFAIAFSVAAAFKWGWRARLLAVPAAYALILVLTRTLGTAPPGYSTATSMSALLGFTAYWLPIAVRWPFVWRGAILRAVQLAPALSTILSLAFMAPPFSRLPFDVGDGSGPLRLRATLIPPQLAFLCLAGLMAGYVAYQVGLKGALMWAAVNYTLLLGTLTRGSIIAGSVILVAILLSAFRKTKGSLPKQLDLILTGVATAALVTAAAVLSFAERDQGAAGSGGVTSGRTDAWSYLLAHRTDILFGSGLNSIPDLVSGSVYAESFSAAHNEYLRALVEYGLVGLCVLLAALLYTAVWTTRTVKRQSQVSILPLWVSVAALAAVDNPLSGVVLLLPLNIVLAMLLSTEADCDTASATLAPPCHLEYGSI